MGAERRQVIRMVIGQAVRLALLGLILGVPAALVLTRVVTSLLYEVESRDPQTFVLVAALITGTALAASWLPARRAAAVDPVIALRDG